MIKKIIILTIGSLFFLTFSHCTNKDDNNIELVDGNGNIEKTSEAQLKNSLEMADQEMGKMLEQMGQIGYQDQNQIQKLLSQFSQSNDKFEKFKLCTPIYMASVNYDLRKKLDKEVPKLSAEQLKMIETAKNHCSWASKTITDFEKSLKDKDWQMIAEGVPNSLVPYKKALFSKSNQCSAEEYKKLLEQDPNAYTDTKTLSSVMIVATLQEHGHLRDYVEKYKKVINDSKSTEKDFLTKFIEASAAESNSTRNLESKKQSLEKALTSFQEIGIKDVPRFVMRSVILAPNCFGSIESGLIDIARNVVTQQRLIALHLRLSKDVQTSGKLPKGNTVGKIKNLNELDQAYAETLLKDKVAVRDKWLRPLMVFGNSKDFKVVSSGKDRKPGTKDDIVFPINK